MLYNLLSVGKVQMLFDTVLEKKQFNLFLSVPMSVQFLTGIDPHAPLTLAHVRAAGGNKTNILP
jgi:hypothetical protein